MSRPMSPYDLQTCEAKITGSWQVVGLDEALSTHITALKRCPVCHGPIMIKTFGSGDTPRSFHRGSHTGCPRASTMYSGTPTQHPDPVS